MKKELVLLLTLLPIIFMCSCDKSKEANIEVIEVSDIVRYKQIGFESVNNYQGKNDLVIEIILHFKNTDYNTSSNYHSNDYYIINGNDKLSPLDLKIGDKLYFDIDRIDETCPCQAYGGYLYLI